jgi:hypothetical protein
LLTKLHRWENRIGDEAIEWLWNFCKSNEQQVIKRAEALQPIACEIILADFSDCDAHPHELRQEGHVFSAHFKQTEDCQDQPAGLRAPVAAADVADPMDETGLPPQSPENVTRVEEIERHLFGPTPLSIEQTHNVNEAQSRDLHTTVPTSTPQQVESGMAAYNLYNPPSQWWPCNPSWPQDPAIPDPQFNPVMSSESTREVNCNTNMQGLWDWDNLIEETYAHLGGGFDE